MTEPTHSGAERGSATEEATNPAPIGWIQGVLHGTLAFFALAFLVSLLDAIPTAAGYDVQTFLLLMIAPSLHLAFAAVLPLLHRAVAGRSRRWGAVAAVAGWLVLMVLRFGPGGYMAPWESRTPGVYWPVPLLIVIGVTFGVRSVWQRFVPGGAERLAWARHAVVLLVSAVLLGLLPPPYVLRGNEFGLVAFPPNDVATADFPNIPGKEGYPVCTFEHNALGYRDVDHAREGDGRTRILMVGDSFMWGDGIESNALTPPYLLRAALEKEAPGKYEVIAAGYPGTGVYGYEKTVERLQPAYDADIVVIGFLGSPDFQAYDSQKRLEMLPDSSFLVHLMVNLGVPQQFHAAAVIHDTSIFSVDRGPTDSLVIMKRMRQHAESHGYRLLILDYDCITPHESFSLDGFDVLPIPDEWKMKAADPDLWYLREQHPKAGLNRKLAGLLATEILRGEASPKE